MLGIIRASRPVLRNVLSVPTPRCHIGLSMVRRCRPPQLQSARWIPFQTKPHCRPGPGTKIAAYRQPQSSPLFRQLLTTEVSMTHCDAAHPSVTAVHSCSCPLASIWCSAPMSMPMLSWPPSTCSVSGPCISAKSRSRKPAQHEAGLRNPERSERLQQAYWRDRGGYGFSVPGDGSMNYCTRRRNCVRHSESCLLKPAPSNARN